MDNSNLVRLSQSFTNLLGDIHGCSAALETLLAAIQPERSDKLILLGDYIDRGPDSRGAIDILLELRKQCWLIPILGNHDRLLLGLLNEKKNVFSQWMSLGGNATEWSTGALMKQER